MPAKMAGNARLPLTRRVASLWLVNGCSESSSSAKYLGFDFFVAHAKHAHFLFERAGDVIDLRIAVPPRLHVALKLAAPEQEIEG